MRTLLVVAATFSMLVTASADTKKKITSKTTALYPSKACKTKVKGEDGSDPILRCPALKGYDVEVGFSAINTYVSVTNAAHVEIKVEGAVGNKLEWRLVDGKPFAVLVEVGDNDTDDDGKPVVRNRRIEVQSLDPEGKLKLKVEIKSQAETQKAWAAARALVDAAAK